MISNFLSNPLLQQYLNRNFAQPVDTGMPVQNKLYQQPYNMFDVSGGITNIPTNINQQPFNDYYGPNNIDTSFGVANEEDVEEDVEGARRTGGLADLLRTVISFAVPGAGLFMGAGRGALEGIQSLNQRFRNTMFGQSATGAEFFQKLRDKRAREAAAARGAAKQNMAEARALSQAAARMAEKYQDFSERTSGAGATGGDRDFSTPAGKSTSYEEASRAFGIGR